MPFDFQVVLPQESIRLNQVRVLPGTPRTLDVTGTDFGSVDEVLVNNIDAPEVVIVSKTRLLAKVPDSLQRASVFSVSVLSKRLTVTPRSLIRFRIGRTPGRVRGILRLVQIFLKVLFTTPGTDIFSPAFGGAALKNVGQTFGADEGGNIVSDLIIAVDTTARQIVAIQGRNPAIPRDERLLSAKVLRSGFNRSEGALVATVEITSQAGQAALTNLEL